MFKVVAMNETSFYNIDAGDAQYIERIDGVYMYNADAHTYVCSLDPAFWLQYLYTNVILSPDTPDDIREGIMMKYEMETGEDCYVAVRNVLLLKDQVEVGELAEDETEDDLREFLLGNPPL